MSDFNANNERAVALEVKSLCGRYVISDLNFIFLKKGIHGILAPKGSGKTELMDILSGSCEAKRGSAVLFGKEISTSSAVKKKIGYVTEHSCFYSNMTVFEIMSFVGQSKGVESGKLYRQIKEALELTGLDNVSNKLVKKLTEFDKKKLAVSAALLGNPDIILIDEPIAKKMSAERAAKITGILNMLGKMKTVVIATELYSVAKELCEDVVILSDGKMVCAGVLGVLEDNFRLSDENHTTLEKAYESIAFYSGKKQRDA